jgi:hypothetical protein
MCPNETIHATLNALVVDIMLRINDTQHTCRAAKYCDAISLRTSIQHARYLDECNLKAIDLFATIVHIAKMRTNIGQKAMLWECRNLLIVRYCVLHTLFKEVGQHVIRNPLCYVIACHQLHTSLNAIEATPKLFVSTPTCVTENV